VGDGDAKANAHGDDSKEKTFCEGTRPASARNEEGTP